MAQRKTNAGRPKGKSKVLYNVRIGRVLRAKVRAYCEQQNISQTRFAEIAFRLAIVTNQA